MGKKSTLKKAKNATVMFLDLILSLAESVSCIAADRKAIYSMIRNNYGNEWSVERICRFVNSLKQRKYIEIVRENNCESVKFTNKAKLKMIDTIASKSLSGKCCFVSFDIPEKYRFRRDKFRMCIKRMGFKQIQKSLWVTDRSIGDLVEMASFEYKVSDYIVYIVSDNTNINNFIEKKLLRNE